MRMPDLSTDTADVGKLWDIYESLPVFYWPRDTRNGSKWYEMQNMFKGMQDDKNHAAKHGRNDWQIAQAGGKGEPY